MHQVEQNIKNRIARNIDQTEELIKLKQIIDKEYTMDSIRLLKRLITEANVQLRLFKLPKSFHDQIPFAVSMVNEFFEKTFGSVIDQHIDEYLIATKEYIDYIIRDGELVPAERAEQIERSAAELQSYREGFEREFEKALRVQVAENDYGNTQLSLQQLLKEKARISNTEESLAMRLVLGEGDNAMPEDLRKMGMNELLDSGGEIIEEISLKHLSDGRISEIPAEKKEKLARILRIGKNLEGETKEIDAWSDDETNEDEPHSNLNHDQSTRNVNKTLKMKKKMIREQSD